MLNYPPNFPSLANCPYGSKKKICEMITLPYCPNCSKIMLRCSLSPTSLALITQEASQEYYFNLKFTLQKDCKNTPYSQTSTLKLLMLIQDCFSWWQCWLIACGTTTLDDAKTS